MLLLSLLLLSLIGEREVLQQILDGFEALALEHRAARRSDAFHVGEWCIEREGQIRV